MTEYYDVAVIGAGVCGANIARKLSQYELKVALLEKEIDVSLGTSKANSGIVHGGFHDNKKYLKARLELQGRPDVRTSARRIGLSLRALRHRRRRPA